MYYHTPNVVKYIRTILRLRIWILTVFILAASLAFTFFRPVLISSDTLYWLSESKEFQKTFSHAYDTEHVASLSIKIPKFDETSKLALTVLQSELEYNKEITRTDSLFSAYHIANEGEEDSGMVRALPIHELTALKIISFVSSFKEPYKQFVNEDFTKFNFIIHSKAPIDVSTLSIPYRYDYSESSEKVQVEHYLGYIAIFILAIVVMSRWLFQNYIAAFGALSVTILTLILTFATIQIITGNRQIHIAMTLMVVSVSIGHFLYFYYRWHISQYKGTPVRALEKSIDRNLAPVLWTLPVLVISLGSLLFADSLIITTLSLSLMISSAFAYVINVTFLPALLSYFTVEHPRVGFARLCYEFANREIHYNHRLLQLFIVITILVTGYTVTRFAAGKIEIFDTHVQHKTITLKVPFEEIDLSMLQKLKQFEIDLRHSNTGIQKVDSVQSVLTQLDMASSPKTPIDEQRVLQALFFLELNDMDQVYMDARALNVTISLNNADQSAIIRWIKEYKKIPFYFTDIETLSESAKMDKRILLFSSLIAALGMIGIVMGIVFRSFKIGLVGFAANAIPVIWFGLIMLVFDLALSIEVLIAMTISVGLTSDTIIHFAYKYFRSRYFGRTKKHALEIMFFYAGIPTVIGAGVLMGVFGLLTLTQLETLQLIGGYGAILMFISLISDLFILPILLLAIDEERGYHVTVRH
jgi:predicted RND superfamily exporter protein